MKSWRKAIVGTDATVSEAIAAIESGSIQVALVLDASSRLVGIVTDGDLRRLQLAGGPLLDRRVADGMSRNPKRIEAEDLAAKALAVMEAHQITSLVIADANGRPHAFIHLHDILGSKIA